MLQAINQLVADIFTILLLPCSWKVMLGFSKRHRIYLDHDLYHYPVELFPAWIHENILDVQEDEPSKEKYIRKHNCMDSHMFPSCIHHKMQQLDSKTN